MEGSKKETKKIRAERTEARRRRKTRKKQKTDSQFAPRYAHMERDRPCNIGHAWYG